MHACTLERDNRMNMTTDTHYLRLLLTEYYYELHTE
jgi:hypothetical protein